MSTRTTGAEHITWDLSVFYTGKDDPRIEQDVVHLAQLASDFAEQYKGKVAHLEGAPLAHACQAMEAIQELQYRLLIYANLNFTTYSSDPAWGAFMQKLREQINPIAQKIIFFELEWAQADDAHVAQVLAHPALSNYAYQLQAERRYKPHRLSEIEEQLLMEADLSGRGAWMRFFDQLMAAVRVSLDGESLTMEQALKRMYAPDRELRQRAADAVTAALRDKRMELTYIFNVLAQDKASDDRRRQYPSWISSRNLSNKAPDSVVDALVNSVTGSYDLVARHYTLKRKLMGFEALYDYDRYAPLNLKESDAFYTWEEARTIVLNAFNAFSPAIGMAAARFFDENWIHAPAMPGKRGGAYANPGTKGTHPFVFVNYQGTARDVMTLAHELGHGVHMLLTTQKQTMMNMYPPLTTSEMASTFAEMMVFQDLLARETDDEVKLGMLAGKIEDTMATVFRQTAMNRFEEAMHTARRSEGELSIERLSELWLATQNDQFQGSVTLREQYGSWWSYIPHFLHTPGYVYAYAFGELLVMALYNLYQQQGMSFIPKYETLLGAGDSANPDTLLAEVGVDLNDPAFWQAGIQTIRQLIEQEEALAERLYPEKVR